MLFRSLHQKLVERTGNFTEQLTLFESDTTKNDHPRQLRHDEALMDLEHMKEWFPTVAYSVLAAHKLDQLFQS